MRNFDTMLAIDTINDWLDRLDEYERELTAVRVLKVGETPNYVADFEYVHRIALRTAGIVRERANSARKRPLPLSVWASLARCGGMHAVRAAEVEPFVQLRRRAEASAEGAKLITAEHVRTHVEGTLNHIALVRRDIMDVNAAAA